MPDDTRELVALTDRETGRKETGRRMADISTTRIVPFATTALFVPQRKPPAIVVAAL
jgi:hypothetical protein